VKILSGNRKKTGMSNKNPPNQFKPGQSGNPNGRPKSGSSWREIISQAVERITDEGISKKEAITEVLTQMALDGDLRAIEVLMDRMDGKPKQVNENRDLTLEENPMYQQLRSMTEKFKEGK
jgi:hypothetical protein